MAGGATPRLEFERRTMKGVRALRVRDASMTPVKVVKSYTPAELDDIVAKTPDIVAIRAVARTMVPGSTGSIFERWVNHYVFHSPIGVKAPRLIVRQADNIHLRLIASARVSDGYLMADGSWWDAKAYSDGSEIDAEQASDIMAMVEAGYVYTPDGVKRPVVEANYIFIDIHAARANRSLVQTQYGGVVRYIDDFGNLQLLP
jgi:hypothetical protein